MGIPSTDSETGSSNTSTSGSGPKDTSDSSTEEQVVDNNEVSKVITSIETSDIIQHTQYAAVETFAKSTKAKLEAPFVPQVVNIPGLIAAVDAVQLIETNLKRQNLPSPIKKKAAHDSALERRGAAEKNTADARKNLADANALVLKDQKAADFAKKAPGYLEKSVLASQIADTVEDVAYVFGYENSQIARNSHDALKFVSGLGIAYVSGNNAAKAGAVLSSALQTHAVENGIKSIGSSYQLNSLIVDGVEIVVGTVVAGLVGGVPYAVMSLGFSGANMLLNAAIENQYIESNGLVTGTQAVLTLVPQIAGAYYNPYKIGKALASIHIVKTASEIGLIGFVKDHTIGNTTSGQTSNNAEVISYGANKALELAVNHPFGDVALLSLTTAGITKTLSKKFTNYGVTTSNAVAFAVPFVLLDVANQFNATIGAIIGAGVLGTVGAGIGGAFWGGGLIGPEIGGYIVGYVGLNAGVILGTGLELASESYPDQYNYITNLVQTHPAGDVGGLALIGAGVTKVLGKSVHAKIAGVNVASPYLLKAALPFIIADVAYQYDALKGAGIGAVGGGTLGGLLGGLPGAYIGLNVGGALGTGLELASESYPTNLVQTHPAGDIGGLALIGAGVTKVLGKSVHAKIAGVNVASPYLLKAALPFIIADVAYQYDALKGAGIGAGVLSTAGAVIGGVYGGPFGAKVGAYIGLNVGGALGTGLELASESYPDQYNSIKNVVTALPFGGKTVGPVEDIGVVNRELGQYNLNALFKYKNDKVTALASTGKDLAQLKIDYGNAVQSREGVVIPPMPNKVQEGVGKNPHYKNDVEARKQLLIQKAQHKQTAAEVKVKLGEAKLVKYAGFTKAVSKFADIVPDLLYLSKKAGYHLSTSYTYNDKIYSAVPHVVDGIKVVAGVGVSALTGNYDTLIGVVPQIHYSALPFKFVESSTQYLNNVHWSVKDIASGILSTAITYYLSSNPAVVAVNAVVYGSSIGLKALESNGYVDPGNKVISYGQAGLEVVAQVMNAATSSSIPVKVMTGIQILCTLDSNDVTVGNIIASDASKKTIGAISYSLGKVGEGLSYLTGKGWGAVEWAKDTAKGHMVGVSGVLVGGAALGVAKTAYYTTGIVSAEIIAPATISYDAYSNGYNTVGGIFGGFALGAIGGLLLPSAVVGATVFGIMGAIGGGIAEYGNNDWYYTISDDSKYPILKKYDYSATKIFKKIKDTSDTDVNQNYDVRQSYNEHITNLYKDVYSKSIREIRCQNGEITEDIAREVSGLRSELESIHYYATSMVGKAAINVRNLFKYKTLELNYDYYHNKGKSDEDIFYSAFKSGGSDLKLENNGVDNIVKLSKKIRDASTSNTNMQKAHPESITNKVVECFAEQYVSNPNDDIVKVFGECEAHFDFTCPA